MNLYGESKITRIETACEVEGTFSELYIYMENPR